MTPEKLPPNPEAAEGGLERLGQLDHSETREYRIFGPPGTGKTRHISRQIELAAEFFGGNARILATSFSRTAAGELTHRIHSTTEIDLSARTLHSHALHALEKLYKALGKEIRIAEAHVELWNLDPQHSHLYISPKSARRIEQQVDGEISLSDEVAEEIRAARRAAEESRLGRQTVGISDKTGDDYLSDLNVARGLLRPEILWPEDLRQFARLWKAYKLEHKLLDFCDLIACAMEQFPAHPLHPHLVVADEAQDLNPMQLKLIRQWGSHAEYFILAGDDDQTIYAWCGAVPDALLHPVLPQGHHIVLHQSYRLPRAVYRLAEAWIQQIPPSRRQAKIYSPRPAEGLVQEIGRQSLGRVVLGQWGTLVPASRQPDPAAGTIMILASCAYMLEDAIEVLKVNAVPFWNPYRPNHTAWNLLRPEPGSAKNQVLALANAYPYRWTLADVACWTRDLAVQHVSILYHGAKAAIAREAKAHPTEPVTFGDLEAWFYPAALKTLALCLQAGLPELTRWWRNRLQASQRDSGATDFACRIAQHPERGAESLRRTPSVIVGTIHSVKGGEADTVVLYPDLSARGMANYARTGYCQVNPYLRAVTGGNPPPVTALPGENEILRHEAILRQFYVGITRAREVLFLVERDGPMSVHFGPFLRASRT